MKKILILSSIILIAVFGFSGYAQATESCTYVSAVEKWSPCSDGMQYATEVTYATTTVLSQCVDVAITRSCTEECFNPTTSQPSSFHDTLGLSFSGLTYYWKADSTSGTTLIDAKGVKNGVLKNGASFSAGKFGNSLSLDGVDDYVELTTFGDATTLSVGGWFYSQNDDIGVIISDLTDHAVNDFEFGIGPNNVYVRADKSGALLRGENEDVSESISTSGLNNSWNHIVWQMEPTVSKLYVNGVLVSTINKTGSQVGYHSPTPDIGRTYDEGPLPWNYGYYKGKIDDLFYITGRVLSECQIKQLALGPNACNQECCSEISNINKNQIRSAHISSCQANGFSGQLIAIDENNVNSVKTYMQSKGLTVAVVANRAVDGDYVLDKKCSGEATWPEPAKTIQIVVNGNSVCFNDIPDTTTSQYAICKNSCSDLAGSCTPSPVSVNTNTNVSWSANISGGTAPYTYSWTASGLTTSVLTGQTISGTYSEVGTKSASVSISDSASPVNTTAINCSPLTVQTPISSPTGFSISSVIVNTGDDIDPVLQKTSCKSVSIEWDEVSGATGYVLYRGTSTDSLIQHATRASTENYYNDTAFGDNGGTYYYAVKSKRGDELSATTTVKSITLPACIYGSCGTNGSSPAIIYYDTQWPAGGTFCSVGSTSEDDITFPTATKAIQSWLCIGNTGTNPTCEAQLSDAKSGVCVIEQDTKPAQDNTYYINKQITLTKGATEIPTDAKQPLSYKWYDGSTLIGTSDTLTKIITTVGNRRYSLRVYEKDGDVIAFCNTNANFIASSGNVQEQ